jgi:hypothetical protein
MIGESPAEEKNNRQITLKRPEDSRGALLSIVSAMLPVVGSFGGSPECCDPDFRCFQFDKTSPKWPGGSETGISLPPLHLQDLFLRLR